MYSSFRVTGFFLLIFLFLTAAVDAKNLNSRQIESQERDSLRVGLVLSGGGALGIAHIGVIQAIEEAGIRIDYITGTSMGSLIGGLYAIGYTSDQLVEIVKSNNFTELFTEKVNRRYISNYEKIYEDRTIATFPINEKRIDLPIGIISGQNVYTFLSRLTQNVHGVEQFDDFDIPFAAVATNLETGEAKVFRSGYLPDALRASISIPSIFSPHEIDGKLYVDGGLIRNLPVEDAIEMGADYTIAVDVSSPLMEKDSLNTITKVLNQSLLFRIHDYADIQRQMADYVVQVDELEPYSAADFDMTDKFLEIGQKAGRKHLEDFKQIASKQKSAPPKRFGIENTGKFPVSNVEILGNSLYDDAFILNQLDFIPQSTLEVNTIEERVSKLYSSQYIDNVTYRLLPGPNEYYTLQINVEENETDDFNVGLRYETGSQASVLFEGNFQNLLHNGSLSRAEIRLGDRINMQTDHIYYGALGSSLGLMTSLGYNSENVDWFFPDRRAAQFKDELFRVELSGGNYFSIQNLVSIGIRRDLIRHSNRINYNGVEASDQNYHSVFLRFIRDKLNRNAYPTSGRKLVLEGYYSHDVIMSELDFTSSDLYYEGYYALTDEISITNTLWLGYTTGRDLPWEYWKSPNRYEPLYNFIRFGGLEPYEISTRNVQMASLGLQVEPFYHRFMNLNLYVGRFQDNWSFNFPSNEFEHGISLSFGALTIVGPAKVILSTGSIDKFRAELQIGYQF
ncbi:MAG: patatin-like phospholipase family protein [Balneolaceae bacterium]|nr:patatin-like phospholipase family protein [Balneolaceae bacterium]